MKVMHGWLPVKHNLGKHSKDGITQCPKCPCEDKMFLHMYECMHLLMQQAVALPRSLALYTMQLFGHFPYPKRSSTKMKQVMTNSYGIHGQSMSQCHRWMDPVQDLWDTLFPRVLDTRNFILHDTPTCNRTIECLDITESWLVQGTQKWGLGTGWLPTCQTWWSSHWTNGKINETALGVSTGQTARDLWPRVQAIGESPITISEVFLPWHEAFWLMLASL